MSDLVFIASNRGDVGGGEMMLLHLATALRDLGLKAVVVGPKQPSDLLERARQQGFPVETVPATDRRSYLMNLRAWDRNRQHEVLWCNGLLPAVATTGRPGRIVHLHQRPTGRQAPLAKAARSGALLTVVPSVSMAEAVPDSHVLPNFIPAPSAVRQPDECFRVGFLGRLSRAKGVDVLVDAVRLLEQELPGQLRMVVGGEARFSAQGEGERIQQRLEQLTTPVEWLGWVDPDVFFGAVDVLVVPSIWPESFGLVSAEAMAAGVPVVVSDAGALPEVVGPDHPWTVPAGDFRVLADVLRSLVIAAPDETARVVAAARSRWAARFSPEAGRRHLQDVLATVSRQNHQLTEERHHD